MAITLEANYSKKLGLPNFSSHQYSVSIGDGLKAIGISLVVYGVIKALARFVRADDRKAARQSRAEGRETPGSNPSGGGEA